MASQISEKAVVSPKAKIGDGCKIFPFVYIEDEVEIGDNCIVMPFVSILNGTRMGRDNKVHQGTVLGALPQDFAFTGERTELCIGNNNIIRENVVINRATHEGGRTVIGDDNFLMEGVHISHDTRVGNKNVFGYGTKIAGDCEIGNGVIFSSSVIENAGTRVGDLAMIQAGTTFSKDVPPYIVAGGKPVGYGGPNNTMMTTAQVEEKVQKHVANAYRLVFHGQNSVFDAVLQIRDQVPDSPEIQKIVAFINATKKGIISKV
ncbi:acyl-ACP--UDP-N-acetylglucosamine O-acyltransferase [Prevotella sp. KH2C16]|uniref:acyl-ACP--UDP-N-acetylglucosamine O-acyltransferase n=1 Tax=Prevotella sp. KH2C16 TaxID=1855325 RepID=UPI0008EC00FB|nr:acyl-ACP--UDP-N-acetylglucosamine O-acyltransferase [Prevotella sp. KH2C16]SFG26126.1 acyl-[acyl-carrier-protein]--UDP-N-acetylglucosamine O-acyltransferase [Prevotella sp. KH2C16]